MSLLVCAATLMGACSDNQPTLPPLPEKKDAVTRFEFALDNIRYAISMPEQAGMREQIDPRQITFDARRGQRQQKVLAFSIDPPRSGSSFDREYKPRKRNIQVLRYRKTDDAGGGSGGATATIEGEFEVGLYKLFLYCSDQSEWALYPEWCLEHLETLELIPAPSGNG